MSTGGHNTDPLTTTIPFVSSRLLIRFIRMIHRSYFHNRKRVCRNTSPSDTMQEGRGSGSVRMSRKRVVMIVFAIGRTASLTLLRYSVRRLVGKCADSVNGAPASRECIESHGYRLRLQNTCRQRKVGMPVTDASADDVWMRTAQLVPTCSERG